MMQLKPNIVLNSIRRRLVRMPNQRYAKTQQVDSSGGKDNEAEFVSTPKLSLYVPISGRCAKSFNRGPQGDFC